MRDLARASGVAWTTVNRLEGGKLVSPATVARLTATFADKGVEIVADEAKTGALIARRGANGVR